MTRQQVIDAMPPDQRDAVARRLDSAVKAGWSEEFCVWECWSRDGKGAHRPLPADQDDVFGFPPGSKHIKPVP